MKEENEPYEISDSNGAPYFDATAILSPIKNSQNQHDSDLSFTHINSEKKIILILNENERLQRIISDKDNQIQNLASLKERDNGDLVVLTEEIERLSKVIHSQQKEIEELK